MPEDVRVFDKDMPAEKQLSIKAPIIIDATTKEGVQPLLNLERTVRTNSNTDIAQEESRRLNPYFKALSVYLKKALDKQDGEKDPALQKLTTPGALKGIFNAMAKCTRNTLTSEVIIVPENIISGPARYIFKGNEFSRTYRHRKEGFSFSFVQIFEDGNNGSTVFPLFTISQKMMKYIAGRQPKALLAEFQGVMTIVNHDMLHHFTSPYILPNTVYKFNEAARPPFEKWGGGIPSSKNGESYESWAQIDHEKALLTPEIHDELRHKIDLYFDELKRIGTELKNTKGSLSGWEKPDHDVVDFFGMMMAHALTRLVPLNHPLMTHCLNRLQDADPHPQDYIEDLHRSFTNGWWQPKGRVIEKNDILKHITESIYPKQREIIDTYRKHGLDIWPQDDRQAGYINVKLVQLTLLCPQEIVDHMPPEPGSAMHYLRSVTDRLTLNMIRIAAQTANYNPLS